MAALTSSSTSPTISNERVVKVLETAITVISFARDTVPVELAQGVLSSMAGILSIVRDTIKNKEDFMGVIQQGNEITAAIWHTTTGRRADDPVFVRATEDLQSTVEKIHLAIKEKSQRQIAAKLFAASIDKEQIANWKEEIAGALRLFFIKLNVLTTVKLDEILLKLEELSLNQVPQSSEKVGHQPPATPTYLFGRSDIIRETAQKLLQPRHVALAGSGGIGKTSIAKAVINDGDVVKMFGDERYFIPFDNYDAAGQGKSTITLDVFADCIADAFGLHPTKADKQKIILSHLVKSPRRVLLVLDNAETFLHAGLDTGRIASMIEELGARPSVVLMFTTRSLSLPSNLQYDVLSVSPLAIGDALEAFKAIYRSPIDSTILSNLLIELECHPLSINLLAHAAERNKWSQEDLVGRWKKERTQVLALNSSAGKSQSLAVSLNLTLNSPSCQDLDPKVSDFLQIIAFLPEGADVQKLDGLVPSVSKSQAIVDSLCQLSLTYRKGQFVTMLAPVRMHILSNESVPVSELPLLKEVFVYYAVQLLRSIIPQELLDEEDALDGIDGSWICDEDVNVERLLSHDMDHATSTKQKVETLDLCLAFMNLLMHFKPRTTILEENIKAIPARRPQRFLRIPLPTLTNRLMFNRSSVLLILGQLVGRMAGEFEKALGMIEASYEGFRALGVKGAMAACLTTQGEMCELLGDFVRAEKYFTLALKIAKHPVDRGRIHISLSILSAFMGRPNAAQLAEAGVQLLESGQQKWGPMPFFIRMGPSIAQGYIAYFNNDQPLARRFFQTAIDIYEQVPDKRGLAGSGDYGDALVGLSGVALREGNIQEALTLVGMDNPQETLGARSRICILGQRASLKAEQGDFDAARDHVDQAIVLAVSPGEGNFEQAMMLYLRAIIELRAGDFVRSRSDFDRAITLFDALSDVRFKSRSYRALGEIAVLETNMKEADHFFSEAKSLCDKMGIRPEFLYVCGDCFALPESFTSWQLYLNGRLNSNRQ